MTDVVDIRETRREAAQRAVQEETSNTFATEQTGARPGPAANDPGHGAAKVRSMPRPTRIARIWVGVFLAGLVLVLYGLEPGFQQRHQRLLFDRYQSDIHQATNEAQGLPGLVPPTKATAFGAPVAILEVPRLRLQQVVVEGALPSNTSTGPGHVSGTAGPGQPGNSVVVGRRAMFGSPFNLVDQLQKGDEILVSTVQGQSVYRVDTVRQQTLELPKDASAVGDADNSALVDEFAEVSDEVAADPTAANPVAVDTLYGPTPDDRITLVTSASGSPFNGADAVVVVGKLSGAGFTPTPQNGRLDSATGLQGDAASWPSLLLVLLGAGAAVVAAVVLYRRLRGPAAYLVTAAPLLVATVLVAEAVSRLLPAWA